MGEGVEVGGGWRGRRELSCWTGKTVGKKSQGFLVSTFRSSNGGIKSENILKLTKTCPPSSCLHNSRVTDQNGVSQACYVVEIYHSGLEPSNYSSCRRADERCLLSPS